MHKRSASYGSVTTRSAPGLCQSVNQQWLLLVTATSCDPNLPQRWMGEMLGLKIGAKAGLMAVDWIDLMVS